jgi:hypothetical protein
VYVINHVLYLLIKHTVLVLSSAIRRTPANINSMPRFTGVVEKLPHEYGVLL